NLMNSEIIGKPTSASFGVVFLNPLSERIKMEDPSQGIIDNKIKKITYKKLEKDTVIQGITATAIEGTVITDRPLPAAYIGEIAYRVSSYSQRYAEDERHIFVNGSNLIEPAGNQPSSEFHFKVYGIPRHAAQVYEGLYCLLLFILFYY